MIQDLKKALSLEEQLILAFSQLNPDIDEINNLLAYPLDWHLVQEKADLHGVAPLIYHCLKKLQNNLTNPSNALNDLNALHSNPITDLPNNLMTRLPSNVIQFFRHAYYENLARNLSLFQELRRILQALNDAGIKVMVLKGAALAETVYGNPALRPMSDLDLLIRKEDFMKAERQLLALGYSLSAIEFPKWWAERFAGKRLYAKGNNLPIYVVEVHWHITNYIWIRSDGRQAEVDRIWNKAQIVRIAGVNTLSLSVEDLILHISIHLAIQHFNFRLIWLRDIGELIRYCQERINWQEIIDRARQLGIERPMHYTLKCSQELLKAQVPDKVLAELKPPHTNSLENRFFGWLISMSEKKMDDMKLLYQYFKIPGIGEKIRFLLGLTFPGMAYMRNRYSVPKSKLVYLYYLYRPCNILYRASLILFRLLWLLINRKLKAQR